MRHHSVLTLTLALALSACVDTTGLSEKSSKGPHPGSNPNSAITVTEYGDLQCPACQGAQIGIVKPLIDTYGSQIRFEFRQFPLSTIHRNALVAAQASECAADQGKFWEYIDLAYERQKELSRSALSSWAKELKLDMDLFERCVDSGIKRDAVIADYDEGEAMGVGGTPTFVLNGKPIDMGGDPQAISKAVQAALDAMKAKL